MIPYEVGVCVRLYQKLWQSRGGLHQFVLYYPMPSSSHGLSLLVGTRMTVLTEIHFKSEGYLSCNIGVSIMLLTIF